jgi:hypothetical protein
MNNLRSKLQDFRRGFRAMKGSVAAFCSSLPPGARAAVATLFLGLTLSIGVGLARDYQRQSELRESANHKRLATLVGEVELGNAVQDFKDCILRDDASYCEDCERHIQVLERTISFYDARGAQRPDERKVLAALRHALADYGSAVVTVRDMESRHMRIEEIDAAVKGADRPIAAGLRDLAELSSQYAEAELPVVPAVGLATCLLFGAILAYLSFPVRTRRRTSPQGSPAVLPQLSSRLFDWDEERKANAFLRLHDGVCQSLSGIMYFLKSAKPPAASADVPESVIPSLQAVIQDTRAVALQLRPPKIQDAGLLATLQSLWVDARSLNTALDIKSHVQVDECEIPGELKPIILRIARMTVDSAESPVASRVVWELGRSGDMLRLSIEAAAETGVVRRRAPSSPDTNIAFDAIQALVVLSGGSLDRVRNTDGSRTLVCSWPLADYP